MRDKLVIAIFIALAVVFGSISTNAGAFEQWPSPEISGINAPMDEGDYIIRFRDSVSQDRRKSAVETSAGQMKFNYKIVNAVAAHLPAPALEMLRWDPDVVDIIPDRSVHAFGKPTAPAGQVIPAGVQRIGARDAGYTGSGVGVAVVDTGIDFKHTDLAVSGNCFTAFNLSSNSSSCQDDNGHGTHVAGIIAALDNTQDVVGVAPGATLYAVKVLDSTGSGKDSDVMAGLDWIYSVSDGSHPIRVVNISLGRPGTLCDNPALRQAVQNLYNKGITVVVSAGNDPYKEVKDMVPATYPEVLAVASTTAMDGSNSCRWYPGVIEADTASYFTTDGMYTSTKDCDNKTDINIGVTISAPGEEKENISKSCFIQSVGILSTKLGGGTTRMSGTSMAAPHVAGVAALMMQQTSLLSPLSPEDVRSKIRSCADRNGVAPLNSPSVAYSFDGEREGIVYAPNALYLESCL